MVFLDYWFSSIWNTDELNPIGCEKLELVFSTCTSDPVLPLHRDNIAFALRLAFILILYRRFAIRIPARKDWNDPEMILENYNRWGQYGWISCTADVYTEILTIRACLWPSCEVIGIHCATRYISARTVRQLFGLIIANYEFSFQLIIEKKTQQHQYTLDYYIFTDINVTIIYINVHNMNIFSDRVRVCLLAVFHYYWLPCTYIWICLKFINSVIMRQHIIFNLFVFWSNKIAIFAFKHFINVHISIHLFSCTCYVHI